MTKKERAILDRTVDYLLEGKPFTMADLAEELKVSRKTLYNYFESRENLLRLTAEHFFTQTGQALAERIKGKEPFLERSRMVLEELARRIERAEIICSRNALSSNQAEGLYKRIYRDLGKRIDAFIREGQTLQWVRDDLEPREISDLFVSLIIGSLHYRESSLSHEKYIAMAIQGLMSKEARKSLADSPNRIVPGHPLWTDF